MSIRNSIYKFYHKLQQSEKFLGLVSWLQEHYVTIIVGDIVNAPKNRKERKNPEKYLYKSRQFFRDNELRVKSVCGMLADEKSRKQYLAAIKYRTERRRIKNDEYSLTDQYFPKDIISVDNNEVFIDGGAYNGDTIHKFIKLSNRHVGSENMGGSLQIVAFEPGKLNMQLLMKQYENDKRVTLIDSGLSAKTGELYFLDRGSSSYLTTKDKANCVVKVSSIDECEECFDATWIKMDIEGAEWDALHGAVETIKRNKPKLTICIYHSDEDMIRIAEWVKKTVPEYKLYIRHHTRRDHETVLYCVI